jgi:tetratricopeptide (TPR) repeat protein
MKAGVRQAGGTVVGRDAECQAISDALSQLQAGHGHAMFLAGEPGIGKSTLARLAAAEAENRGIPVFWGFAWETGGAPAYWPWTQLLRPLVERFAPGAELTDKLAQMLPGTAGAGDLQLQPEQARFMLLEAVRALLEAVSRQSQIMLVFEDLHAADNDSLQMLQHVAKHLRSMPVLLLGTFREFDARTSLDTGPLWQCVRDAEVLTLKRLLEQEVREFLSLTGAAADDEFVGILFNTTAGNPLFVGELAEVLARQKSFDARPLRLPQTIQQVIGQQLDQLPDVTRSLLSTAAVLGRHFSASALPALTDLDPRTLSGCLQAALDAEVIKPVSAEGWEFNHVLYRDVLYQELNGTRREELHRRRARVLQLRIDGGETDRWGELALHMDAAGSSYRNDAIHAWREAGRRANERLAFEEAVRSYQRALETFGEGPRFPPAERCALLLDLAAALITQGNVESGHKWCREAFTVARTLDDAQLMAESALTYGNAIVVAKVDRELVAMLQESLRRLPKEDGSTRSRVAARLAAAMQPALNPAEPMQTAREAIELARGTGDERVVYDVLKSAISALMDFAPADERIPLNREFESLARRFGDAPGEFRSNLRLMIDASELGDRRMIDDTIDTCERIANRIGLPHYQWRVASARAMQATIEGRFETAMQYIDEAEQLAEAAGDHGARLTVPVQRFAILYEWDSPQATPLEVIEPQLLEVFAILPDAEIYARPVFASFYCRSGRTDSGLSIIDQPLVERILAGGDRFSLARLGEVAAMNRNRGLAAQVLDALRGYESSCATMGLLGMQWAGPVAYTLALLYVVLGRLDEASQQFARALEMARQMRAQPTIARIYQGMSELAERTGDVATARLHASVAAEISSRLQLRPLRLAPTEPAEPFQPQTDGAAGQEFCMSLEGDVWNIGFHNRSALIRDSRGLRMLARLVAEPDRDIHVLDLSGSGEVGARSDPGDAGPALDDKARQEYRRRVRDLEEELDEARELADQGRVEALRDELDFIARELSRAFGLGGRQRRAGAAAERARVNVRRRVKDAIRRIEKQLPEAGKHLDNSVKTGSYCRYAPS